MTDNTRESIGEHTDEPPTETDEPPTETDEPPTETDEQSQPPADVSRQPQYVPPRQDSFDWRGWLLVCVIVISFLIIPGAILYLPAAQEFVSSLGLGWRQAYLTLPMIPAILLGFTAIWSAVRSRSSDGE